MTCWTQSLHEYTMDSPPQGQYEEAARAFLCTQRSRSDPIAPDIATLLRAWLQQRSELVSRNALSTALPYTEDFHRLGGSLLTWGLTRPWAHEIRIQQTFEQWLGVLHEPNLFSDTLALNMAYATKIVSSLLPQLPPRVCPAIANLWLNRIMRTSPQSLLWQVTMYKQDVREHVVAAWCDLYTIAKTNESTVNAGVIEWLRCVDFAIQKVGYNRIDILLMLLSNASLPSTAKVCVAASQDPNLWLNPAASSVLLPLTSAAFPAPSMRIYHMPWTVETNTYYLTSQQRVDAHRRVCEIYCPELTPLFSLLSVDWLSKESVCRAAHQYALTSSESLPVTGLLDQDTGVEWYN